MRVSTVWKAIVGGVAAGSAAAATAVQDGTVSSGEWLTIALAVLAAYGVTWRVPNRTGEGPSA